MKKARPPVASARAESWLRTSSLSAPTFEPDGIDRDASPPGVVESLLPGGQAGGVLAVREQDQRALAGEAAEVVEGGDQAVVEPRSGPPPAGLRATGSPPRGRRSAASPGRAGPRSRRQRRGRGSVSLRRKPSAARCASISEEAMEVEVSIAKPSVSGRFSTSSKRLISWRLALLQDLEVLTLQTAHEAAGAVGHGGVQLDQIDLDLLQVVGRAQEPHLLGPAAVIELRRHGRGGRSARRGRRRWPATAGWPGSPPAGR